MENRRAQIVAILIGAALLLSTGSLRSRLAGRNASPPVPPQGAYFVQDNLVNSRLLDLEPRGTYNQIDVDRTAALETDRGTWEKDAKGAVLLHPVGDGLRFRALCSAPLTIVLDRPGVLEVLPSVAAAIRRFLAQSQDDVFARTGIAEIGADLQTSGVSELALSIDPKVETFSRPGLLSLAHQVDDLIWSRRNNTYILSPVPNTSPQLLVLQGALFQARDLARVEHEHGIKPGQAPPFYYARVGAKEFARRAGRWKVLQLPGRIN